MKGGGATRYGELDAYAAFVRLMLTAMPLYEYGSGICEALLTHVRGEAGLETWSSRREDGGSRAVQGNNPRSLFSQGWGDAKHHHL